MANLEPIQMQVSSTGWLRATQHVKDAAVKGRRFMRELFYECTFKNLRGTVFEHCSLLESSFEPDRIEDLLGLTLTLDCFTFKDVRLNKLTFDALVYLLAQTKGNDQQREVLMRLLDAGRAEQFDKVFANLELRHRR